MNRVLGRSDRFQTQSTEQTRIRQAQREEHTRVEWVRFCFSKRGWLRASRSPDDCMPPTSCGDVRRAALAAAGGSCVFDKYSMRLNGIVCEWVGVHLLGHLFRELIRSCPGFQQGSDGLLRASADVRSSRAAARKDSGATASVECWLRNVTKLHRCRRI
jgi:hypothetical protein